MILAVNITNDYVSCGLYSFDSLISDFSFSRFDGTTKDEIALLLKMFFYDRKIPLSDIDGCCISSVVPCSLSAVSEAVDALFSVKPLVIGHGIKTGVNIRIDNHNQLGSDIVANIAACNAIYNSPFIIVDLGTATTISYVNEKKEFIGTIIAPGVSVSVKALSSSAAALPEISISTPKSLIGKNTFDSMVSGCILGAACMIDGLVDRIVFENRVFDYTLIATGTYSSNVIPYCNNKFELYPTLTLDGIKNIYYLNKG